MSLTNLPSLSVEQTATSSNSQAPTAISSGVTGSPAAISSAETLPVGQNTNLLSTTDPEPLTEMDSIATDTNSLSSYTTRPAFPLLQLTAAGLPLQLLATSPATVLTVLATDAYKSVLEAQRKACLAFFLSHPPPPSKFFPPSLPCTFTAFNRSRGHVKDRSGCPMLLLPTTRTPTPPSQASPAPTLALRQSNFHGRAWPWSLRPIPKLPRH